MDSGYNNLSETLSFNHLKLSRSQAVHKVFFLFFLWFINLLTITYCAFIKNYLFTFNVNTKSTSFGETIKFLFYDVLQSVIKLS